MYVYDNRGQKYFLAIILKTWFLHLRYVNLVVFKYETINDDLNKSWYVVLITCWLDGNITVGSEEQIDEKRLLHMRNCDVGLSKEEEHLG